MEVGIVADVFGEMMMLDASEIVSAVLQEQARKEYVRRVAGGEPASDVYLSIERRLKAA